MQCPNCRKVEKGNWLYANGRSYLESGIDEWTYDEDLYDLNYSDMVCICCLRLKLGIFLTMISLPHNFYEKELSS